MVSVDLQPLIEGLTPASLFGLATASFYVALIAMVSCVAIFSRGERSKNAIRVLKVLTRRKPGPPSPGST
jgi:hypothetical protein